MKKTLVVSTLALAVVFLAGCGQPETDTKNQAGKTPVSVSDQKTKVPDEKPAADGSQTGLPESVSTQPGVTADEEIKNIDKDLQAIDDSALEEGLSDADLGL